MRWFKRWGWVIAFILFAVFVVIVTAGQVRPNIKAEVDGAKAEAAADKLVARLGRDEAKKKIEEQYVGTIKAMDEADHVQAKKLDKDPSARAKFYARVAAKHAKRKR